MSVNGWFPKLRADGVIASGNAGIWVTPLTGPPVQVSPVGIAPFWAGQTLCYNLNNNTTQIGTFDKPLQRAYNDYASSDDGQWAGFVAGTGRVDRYRLVNGFYIKGASLVGSVIGASAPRFYGSSFGYLFPYQPGADNQRTLFIDGVAKAHGVLLDWVADRTGQCYLYVTATGTYTKRIFDQEFNDITIRSQQDETPIAAFIAPDGLPWILSGTTNAGTFVRYLYSAAGYVIQGELFYPDCRVLGDRLRVVGSSSAGEPRTEWIDFTSPMQDLRLV